MTKSPSDVFQELLTEAKTDPNILGFFFGGSRGKGYENDLSDYDVRMIVKDEVIGEYKNKFGQAMSEIDLAVMSLSEFSTYAEWQSDSHWDRYNFTHVKTLVDKTGGKIQELIDKKGSIPKEYRDEFINGSLDTFFDGFHRSARSHRKQDLVGMRLEAAASIPHALNALFALHNRATPYPCYLTRELEHHPLEKFPWSGEKLLESLLKILENGNLEIQQELAKEIETVFRREGCGEVFDNWKTRNRWAER